MSSPHDALLDELWSRFGHIARDRVDLVAAAVALLRAGSPDAASVCRQAELECHKLVGSLDSYGRAGGSALAARAEVLLAEAVTAPRPEGLQELGEVVDGLRALVDSTPVTASAGACICGTCGNVHAAPAG